MTGKNPRQAGDAQALYSAAMAALSARRYEEGAGLLEKLLAMAPPSSEIHNNLGTAHWKCGRHKEAEGHYAAAVRLAPDNAVALNNYGGLLMEELRLDEAEGFLKRAHALNPRHPAIANNMGLMHGHRGNSAAAEQCFRAAIAARPDWSDAHANLGNVYQQVNRDDDAVTCYHRALSLDANNAAAWKDMGCLYFTMQRHKESEAALRRALALRPQSEATWNLLLQQLELMSRLDEAAVTVEEARKLFPDSPPIMAVWARLQRRGDNTAAAVAEMEKILPGIERDSSKTIGFFYELGQLYDRSGDADKAFDSFRRANDAQAAEPEALMFDKKALTSVAERLEAALTPAFAKSFPAAVPEDRASPVFLVGFPRSGTTLLDQILSSHPGVCVAEENPAVIAMGEYFLRKNGKSAAQTGSGNVWDKSWYPSAIPLLQPDDIVEMRNVFWREHRVDATLNDRLFVDKLPVNALHAAFIHTVFPKAKFILALRHPCDCVLSCYMQAFNLNNAMVRFLDLEDSARFYDEIFRVWEQTRKVLPLDVHTVRYEDVVGDFRPTVESLLSYLGLPWNDAVLEYDKTAKAKERINTPSYAQVTQKIYTRARGRWLKYRKHMEPVLDILAPHAERYGYSMDAPDAQK